MRRFQLFAIMAGLCSAFAPLSGQSNDWQSVEKLAPGTSISVVKKNVRQGCELVQATDTELLCDEGFGGIWRRRTFQRDEVREVRLEEPRHNKMILGAVVGAAVGGLIGFVAAGQSSDPEARGYARAYGVPLGVLFGGLVGREIHLHGPVVYRQP
jgi:hypothetical protein